MNNTDRKAIRHQRAGVSSSGFTLLEVLLAMAILAVVLTAIYASFSSAGAGVEHAEAARDATDLARTLIARMSADISNVYCGGVKGAFLYGKKEEKEAEGEKYRIDSLSLTTLTNWRRPESRETELWEVGYFFKEKPEGNGRVLMRREKRTVGGSEEDIAADATEYEITDAVRSLQIRYLVGAEWKDEIGSAAACDDKSLTGAEITLTTQDGRVFMTQVDMVRSLN